MKDPVLKLKKNESSKDKLYLDANSKITHCFGTGPGPHGWCATCDVSYLSF